MGTSTSDNNTHEEDLGLSPEAEQRRQMALRHVRQYPDPVLRAQTIEVTAFNDELVALADRMNSIMSDAAGVGLAAPQLGLRMRLFVYHPDEGEPEAVVNPQVTFSSDETEVEIEGCLSLGDLVRVPVRRPVSVKVEGQTLTGENKIWDLEGYYARVFQHEIDHLDGVLMVDRVEDKQARREAMRLLRPRP